MGFIYLVTNKINGKQYVGKTKFDINTRWIQHKSEAKRLKPNVYFVRALNKYGCDNFTVKEIEQCPDDLLFEREKYYIKQYDTYNNGYNSTLGGEGNHKYETDDILSLWNDGFTASEIADTMGSCVDTICLTLKANEITTTKIRSRAQSKISQYKKKAILQYSLDGILLNKFSCIQEAVQQTGYSETSIRDVCNHHRHSSNGYIWCHEDEPKSIQQLINYGKEFSKQEIADALNISLSAVIGSINPLEKKGYSKIVREEVVELEAATETRKAKTKTVKYHTLTEEGLAYDPIAEEAEKAAAKQAEKERKAAERAAAKAAKEAEAEF